MDRIGSRRILAALGLSLLVAVALGTQFADAQTEPRQLPATPQTDSDAPDIQREALPPPPPAPDAQPGRQGTRQLPPRDDRQFARRGNRLERRLDFLHSELRITDEQDRLWDDFANAVRGEAQEARGRLNDVRGRGRGRGGDGIVERLERRQERLDIRSGRLDRLLSTLRPLYAALDETQKQAADELLFRPDRGRNFRRGFGRGPRFGRYGDRFGADDFRGDDFAADAFDWRFGPNPNTTGNRYYRYYYR